MDTTPHWLSPLWLQLCEDSEEPGEKLQEEGKEEKEWEKAEDKVGKVKTTGRKGLVSQGQHQKEEETKVSPERPRESGRKEGGNYQEKEVIGTLAGYIVDQSEKETPRHY